jgi:hypothetical protein
MTTCQQRQLLLCTEGGRCLTVLITNSFGYNAVALNCSLFLKQKIIAEFLVNI